MTPESAISDIVARCFPGSRCEVYREEAKDFFVFKFRIVVGDKVWGLTHRIPGEVLDAHPELAAKELVEQIKWHMQRELPLSPLTGMPKGNRLGYLDDGWYDTDKRRREEARVLELARLESERQEEEAAKASILDAIAKRAAAEPR